MPPRQSQTARATIRDVAEQAGVSVSSVSRVMNGEPHISPELHARIMRAVTRLRFEVQAASELLAGPTAGRLLLVLGDTNSPEPRLRIGETGLNTVGSFSCNDNSLST